MSEQDMRQEIQTLRDISFTQANDIGSLNLKVAKLETKDKCNGHGDCMERINENLKKIELTNASTQGEIKGFVNSVNEFIVAIRDDVYGKDGLMPRTKSLANQLILQWGVLVVIITGVVATFLKR
jgi:hypothetical protein